MRALLLSALALLMASCSSLQMQLPDSFLQLNDSTGVELRAVTADDGRLWAREFDVGHEADAELWLSSLLVDLRDRRGYELGEVGSIQDAAGHDGFLVEGSTRAGGSRCGYLLAVFPIAGTSDVRTVEFVAQPEEFAALRDAVLEAIGTLQ